MNLVRWSIALAVGMLALGVSGDGTEAGEPVESPWTNVVGNARNISMTPGQSQAPVGAANDRGWIVVAWSEVTTGGADIFATFSMDSGATWSAPENLSDDPVPSLSPVAWATADTMGVGWLTIPSGATGPITFAYTTGDGWIPGAENITDASTIGAIRAHYPAVDGSGVHVTYTANGLGFTVSSLDGGITWGEPQQAPVFPFYDFTVDSDGTLWAVYVNEDSDVEVWRGVDHITNEEDNVEYVLDHKVENANANRVQIGHDGRNGLVVYWSTNALPVVVSFVQRPNPQAEWTDPVNVSRTGHTASDESFAAFGMNYVFLWVEFDLGTQESRLWARTSTDGGNTLSDPFEVSSPSGSASDDEVVLTGDVATVIYGSEDDNDFTTTVALIDLAPPAPADAPTVSLPADLPLAQSDDLTFPMQAWTSATGSFAEPLGAGGNFYPFSLLVGMAAPEGANTDDIWTMTAGPAGDGNCDNVTDGVDGVPIAAGLAGFAVGACTGLRDVDCSEDVDASDLMLVLKSVAGLPVDIPAQCPTARR